MLVVKAKLAKSRICVLKIFKKRKISRSHV